MVFIRRNALRLLRTRGLIGLLHVARQWDAERFVPAFVAVAEAGFTVVPGIRVRSERAGRVAVEALGASAGGCKALVEMRRRARKPTLRKLIDSILEKKT